MYFRPSSAIWWWVMAIWKSDICAAATAYAKIHRTVYYDFFRKKSTFPICFHLTNNDAKSINLISYLSTINNSKIETELTWERFFSVFSSIVWVKNVCVFRTWDVKKFTRLAIISGKLSLNFYRFLLLISSNCSIL